MTAWEVVATEGTRLKRQQLYREIRMLKDERERSNLSHTYDKLFMFLEDDLRAAIREARRAP